MYVNNTGPVNFVQIRKSPWHAVEQLVYSTCLKEGLVLACEMGVPAVPQR